jgi:anhydro-N-acetylmuramic acid kinase
MNPFLQRLAKMPEQSSRLILGLMSGTSLDGLDMALCRISEHGLQTKMELMHFETCSYTSQWREQLTKICAKSQVDSLELCLTNNHLAKWHATKIKAFLKKNNIDPKEVDLIASHGHTFFHAPYFFHQNNEFGHSTFQIADGDHIAHDTGIITIHDFRQKHVAAGGEGAPLALFGDFLLFAHKEKNRILLNIGGISNISHIPPGQDFSICFASDLGPGNSLMDRWMQHLNLNIHYDQDGEMAAKGEINTQLLSCLKEHSFFGLPLPKTTGPETFNFSFISDAIEKCDLKEISDESVMATLNRFTAECIYDAISPLLQVANSELIVSGGGVFNKTLMKNISALLGEKAKLIYSDDFSVPAEAKEAILFALLANEMVCGSDAFRSNNTKAPGINMGKISLPL